MGKGSRRRPSQISRAEYDLKWALAYGRITFAEYERKLKALRKTVGKNKERWALIAEEVDEPGSVKGLTFEERRVVNWLKIWADEWADRKGLPQSKRVKDYIPHLFEQELKEQALIKSLA